MASTYLSLHYHLVFATKNREAIIAPEWRSRLHEYLGASTWVHEKIGLQSFAWQEGYAAFTVSAPARPAVQQYIANQEEHHRARSSRDELLDMLAKAGIEYDSRYFE